MNGRWLAVLVVGGVVVAGASALRPGGWLREEGETALEGVPVRRGRLRIREVVSGNLAAKNSLSLRCELEGRTTVLSLISEGTMVEPGDVVCELDTSELDDRLVVQKISEQNAAADFTKAREQFEIQKIQNTTDIAQAELALDLARLDLEKYTIDDGEWVHEQKQAEEAIKLKEEELKRAEAQLEWTEKLYERGFAQGTELEADQAQVARVSVEVEQARRDLALKLNYGHQRTLAELRAEVETRERDIEKVKKQAEAHMADYLAARNSAEIRWELEREKLRKLEEQSQKGKVRAPVRGMVIYAREQSRWGQGEPVQEGAEVRERQELVTIPREGGMIVKANLHETVLDKVRPGLPCTIRVDALPNLQLRGAVGFVAVLPDANAWYANPNQRIYGAEITIDEATPELRPGMSASVEILVTELDDARYVPVQSVVLDGGRTVVFVRQGARIEKRQVEVGLDDGKLVEIREGLAEGEIVLLSSPPDFEPKPLRATGGGAPPAGATDGEDGSRRPEPPEDGLQAGPRPDGPPAEGEGSRFGAERDADRGSPDGERRRERGGPPGAAASEQGSAGPRERGDGGEGAGE